MARPFLVLVGRFLPLCSYIQFFQRQRAEGVGVPSQYIRRELAIQAGLGMVEELDRESGDNRVFYPTRWLPFDKFRVNGHVETSGNASPPYKFDNLSNLSEVARAFPSATSSRPVRTAMLHSKSRRGGPFAPHAGPRQA